MAEVEFRRTRFGEVGLGNLVELPARDENADIAQHGQMLVRAERCR